MSNKEVDEKHVHKDAAVFRATIACNFGMERNLNQEPVCHTNVHAAWTRTIRGQLWTVQGHHIDAKYAVKGCED